MRKTAYLFLLLLSVCRIQAQIVTNPFFPTDDKGVHIIFDASKGNQGLLNYSGDIYIHTGVITDKSTNSGDWKYVTTTWNTNDVAARMVKGSGTTYSFTIPNIRSYYNVPAGEKILKIAMVFRSYNPSGNALEGKNSDLSVDQGNIYWDVYPAGTAAVRYTKPAFEPRFKPFLLPQNLTVGSTIEIEARSTIYQKLAITRNGAPLATENNDTIINFTATIPSAGEHVFIVTNPDNPSILSDTFRVYVALPTTEAPLPAGLKEGINYEAGGIAATLVLKAPGKTRVNLLGDFNNWEESLAYQMNKTPDGNHFWLRITGLNPSTEYAYQYLVDGTLKIGDPYCEKILDPWNDPFISAATYPNLKAYPTGKTTGIVSVLQTNAPGYTWQVPSFQRPAKEKLVIYEVLLRDFVEKHDWTTLKDSIGYFKNLGVNALHLMPFNEFEGNSSWGYNPSYYFAPDKYYGPKNTLKAFIDECHKNGIAVVMDMVLNHSFGQSPMVQLYFDAVNNRPAANNPWFNPVAKHAFNVGYDMNHEAVASKKFFSDVCSFWLQEYKLDGFRFDLSKGFTQTKTCDDSGGNCDVNGWSSYDASRVAIWKAYYDTLQLKAPGSYVILEHLGSNNEENELSNYGMMLWGNMNYNFTEAAKGQISNSNFSGALHTVRNWQKPHLISYMESHDEERSMVKCKNEGASIAGYNIREESIALKRNELAASFLLAIPGPKLIWQFGELGYDLSINYCPDGTVNNNCRTDPKPIRWNYYQNAGRVQLRNVYKTMLELRNNQYFERLFIAGEVQHDLVNAVKWLRLTSDSSKIVVVGNFGTNQAPVQISFPQAGIWFELFTGEPFAATGNAQSINLPAGGYKVFLNRNLNGSPPTPVRDIETTDIFRLRMMPNPVQVSSIIRYELPEAGKVQFTLMDMNGRSIGIIPVGNRAIGAHQTRLDPALVGSLQKGIYLLQLQVNDKRKIIKLLVQ
ncbi:alpha-amylase family glycosyl hydrolase [Flavihumibacter sp. UBA7668]|uniref:alpha-amylase family glycosyl hydrolase n=1 Tax=Flavihumibacter sp. UBA7668 TaxID=1946542 RepID=UPI0025BFF2B8|nr:alpha-amylase family glycosyl hydrolase [Flavihumibacter sp. UBA7668]